MLLQYVKINEKKTLLKYYTKLSNLPKYNLSGILIEYIKNPIP